MKDVMKSSGTENLAPLGLVVERALEQMKEHVVTQNDNTNIQDLTFALDSLLEHIHINKPQEANKLFPLGKGSCVYTGFIDIDNHLQGIHPGELIVIGSRPAMGKTSFALNIAKYASMDKKKNVAVFTLEMPRKYIAMRVLCQEALVNPLHAQLKKLTTDEWGRITEAAVRAMTTPMYIDDTPGLTPAQIRSRSLQLMENKGLDLIVVDYLWLMKSDEKMNNKEITSELKAIALELNVPIIVTAQLKRADINRPDKRPVLNDLSSSKFIEKNADVIMLLYREGYYNCFLEDPERNICEVIIITQSDNHLKTVELFWLDNLLLFANISEKTDQENNEDHP